MKITRRNITLLLHTCRYLKFSQIYYKTLNTIRFRLYKIFPRLAQFQARPKNIDIKVCTACFLTGINRAVYQPNDCLDSDDITDNADKIAKGEFGFLSITRFFPDEIGWRDPSLNHLWRYQLQYFNYAKELGMAGWLKEDSVYFRAFCRLVDSWIVGNPYGSLDGWHPFTISIRVVNWIYAYVLFADYIEEDTGFQKRFLKSLHEQCNFLSRHLEFEARGNHLLSNLKALIFAGLFFNRKDWLDRGLKYLPEELDEQILSDGGHFERSPMYHLIVMQDLIECYWVMKDLEDPIVGKLTICIERMKKYLVGIHLFGHMPLVNDSSCDLMPDTAAVWDLAQCIAGKQDGVEPRLFSWMMVGRVTKAPRRIEYLNRSSEMAESGYYVIRSDDSAMLIDCGRVCPDYLPAHGHADMLSYELWLSGEPLITDSGVYEYTAGKWRDYFRSTRAHNTIVVDGQEQSEIWGSFRIARRAFPQDIVWGSGTGIDYFSGAHSGYHRLADPVTHRRRIVHVADMGWIIIDTLEGDAIHLVENYVNFHPDVKVAADKPDRLELAWGDQEGTLWHGEGFLREVIRGAEDPPLGWYSDRFGTKVERTTLCLKRKGKLPILSSYIITHRKVNIVNLNCELGSVEKYMVRLDDVNWNIVADVAQGLFSVTRI
jgi:hypothetical protein